jgi:hypothetical protein
MRRTWTRRGREARRSPSPPQAETERDRQKLNPVENLTAEQVARRSWAVPSHLLGGAGERDRSH